MEKVEKIWRYSSYCMVALIFRFGIRVFLKPQRLGTNDNWLMKSGVKWRWKWYDARNLAVGCSATFPTYAASGILCQVVNTRIPLDT